LLFQRTGRFEVGTLNAILRAVAQHKETTRDAIIRSF